MLKATIRPLSDLQNHYEDIVKLLGEYGAVVIKNNGVEELAVLSMGTFVDYDNYLLNATLTTRNKHPLPQ